MNSINFNISVKINFKKSVNFDETLFCKNLIYLISLLDNSENQPLIKIRNFKEYKKSLSFLISFEFIENKENLNFYKSKSLNIGIKKVVISYFKELTKEKIKVNVKRIKK